MTPRWSELTQVFAKIGVLSFGGPAAQIAFMQSELVETRKWLRQDDFLRALSFCMLLPGPEAMQLATYAGWRLRGVAGGLLAGMLFVGPGAAFIAILAFLYVQFGTMKLVQVGFVGVQVCVTIVVVRALIGLASRALPSGTLRIIAACSFASLFMLGLPFPLVVLLAGLAGAALVPSTQHDASQQGQPSPSSALPILGLGGVLWVAPLVICAVAGASFLFDLGVFFSQLAIIGFGGAYAILTYMAQVLVSDYGWIDTGQMIDALGLAETTPGPLILVTQFVAMIAGHELGGAATAFAAGGMALWVTFVPCFIWIFVGAPYIDRLGQYRYVETALAGISAAVVGVIANLSLWFAQHVFFEKHQQIDAGFAALTLPVWNSLSIDAAILAVVAGTLILRLRINLLLALPVLAALAIGIDAILTQ